MPDSPHFLPEKSANAQDAPLREALISETLAQVVAKKIDLEAARSLVADAANPDHIPNVEVWALPKEYAPPFFVFEANKLDAAGSPLLGNFAVNSWAGDVWNTGGLCHWVTNPALKITREKIRKTYARVELKSYAQMHQLKPWCDAD